MKGEKVEMRLCLGSSCYSRGNNEVLEVVKDYIDQNELSDKVDFRGHLCKGNCNHGPNFSILNNQYNEVSISNITLILEDFFKSSQVEKEK
ncbi:MAG: (2Fe-2S) ferredoxin domain-containing protein [Bacteroidota bacterium]